MMTGDDFSAWFMRLRFANWTDAAHALRIGRSTFFASLQADEIPAEREQLCRALEIVRHVADTPDPNGQTRWIPFTPEMVELAKELLKEP